ncbi:hypothetical protein [Planktotalea sp.]|uniref:hypothetical protein n=1 Tax=Planktotalea sp. TaxID=2029877 RepID=UPI003D6C5A8A
MRYPTPTAKEKQRARIALIIRFPIYMIGLVCVLRRLIGSMGSSIEAMAGPNWQTLIAFSFIVAVIFGRTELMVASFKLHKAVQKLRLTPGALVIIYMFLPLICSALEYAYFAVSPNPVFLIISSILAIPLFSVLGFGSYDGIVDPYWPASFKKLIKEQKQKQK